MDSNDGKSHDPPSSIPIVEAQPKSFGVAAEGEVTQQQAPVPDPRWPYLGRWSAIPPPIVPAKLPSMVKETENGASLTSVTGPPSTADATVSTPLVTEITGAPPISATTTHSPQTIASPPPAVLAVATINSHLPASSPTQELNEVTEGILVLGNSVIDGSTENKDSDAGSEKEGVFVRSLGAWSKPLHFTPPPTPYEPATPTIDFTEAIKSQIASFWPSLSETTTVGQKQKKGKQCPDQATPQLPAEKIPLPALKDDGSLRFPWAARMNQSSRNLFRAAEPTYRLDGTPQVTIPSKVLKLGPENSEEYIIGQFHRCSSPPGGLVHAVLNKLWGRECKISCRKLGDSSFLFHIPHSNTRNWVVQRGIWHVDGCLLFVAPWSPVNSLKTPEISTLPVWVTLKNIPDSCFSRLGISHIASGLGEPMLTHRPRLDPTFMGEAKILVEIELDKQFPKQIALDDKQGNIYLVEVVYSWIPSACERCGALGHKEKRCLQPVKTLGPDHATKDTQTPNEEVPMVDITNLLQQTPITPATNLEQNQISTAIHQEPETPKKSSPTGHSEDPSSGSSTNLHEVHSIQRSKSDNTLLSLAATVAAPTESQIMEETPSLVHFTKASNSLEKEQSFGESFNEDSPHSKNIYQIHPENQLGCGDDKGQSLLVGETSGYNTTRGGRPIKPTQKIQEMEWTTVRGRGKRGRQGRGTHYR